MANIKSHIFRSLAFITLAAAIVALFPRYSNTFRYHYEIGKPWGYTTLTAPFDFRIYKNAEQLEADKHKLLSEVKPYFRFMPNTQRTKLVVSLADYEWLTTEKYTEVVVVKGPTFSQTYPISEIYSERSAYIATGVEYRQNLEQDTAKMNALRAQALSRLNETGGEGLAPIAKGQRIIENGELVNSYTYQVLQSLSRAYEEKSLGIQQRLLSTIGEALLVVLFLSLFIAYLFVFRRSYLQKTSVVLFFCLQILLVIALACLALRFGFSVYMIPFAWVPILTRVFLDSRTALFLHFTTILITSIVVPAPETFFFIQIGVGMVAVSSLSDMTRRAQLVQTAGWILLVQTVAYTAITFAQSGTFDTLAPMMYLYFAICAALTIGCYGLIYLFEKIFHFISSITLVELTDLNSDLLHKLAEKAPGTFQHSMQVSNLASEAAKAIGANALLVRTGALYHDIGKTANPLYFVENQQGVENPLLTMDPREAAKVVIAHVAEGEKIARKSHLPEAVINFITTHHGTSLVRYFYNTYCNAHPEENVDQSLFRYPGSKPSTKEGAILMMADAIEARSRSLDDFSEASIAAAVNQMIDSQIADGQFSETPLSFKDVEDIRRVFISRLVAMNHHRISYPTLNK